MRALTIVLAILFLAGCGVQYRNDAEEFLRTQPASAWGDPPTEIAHRYVELRWLNTILKDPLSAQITHGALQRGTIAKSMTNPTVVPVWYSIVSVNAKNSFGGYTGAKSYVFYYIESLLVAIDSPEEGRTYINPGLDTTAVDKADAILGENDHMRSAKNPAAASPSANPTTATDAYGKPSPAPVSKNDFKAGQLARSIGCEAPKLLNATPSTETYQTACPGGQYKLISCEFTNCRVMQ